MIGRKWHREKFGVNPNPHIYLLGVLHILRSNSVLRRAPDLATHCFPIVCDQALTELVPGVKKSCVNGDYQNYLQICTMPVSYAMYHNFL